MDRLPRQFGRYTLLSLLGEGGMARVYEAEFSGPAGFRKRAAVKVIRLDALDRDEARTRALINEARVGGLLKHPNIVDTYDFGLVDGQPYVAMELVEGVDLARLLRQGPPPVGVACSVAASICAGLHHAHELRDGGRSLDLVHRDLKPSNVLMGRSGEVKVVDFGLAKATAVSTGTTGTGIAKGTPPYMSPEQLQAAPLDRRSDVFALGAVLYELFTGRRFFDQPTAPSVITAIVHVEDRIAPPSKLDALDERLLGLSAIVRRCLRLRVEDRYDDAGQVRADILRLGANVEQSGSVEDWLGGAVGELAPTSAWDRPAVATEDGSLLDLDRGSSLADLPPTVVAPRSGGSAAPPADPPDDVGPTRPAPGRPPKKRWHGLVFGLLLLAVVGMVLLWLTVFSATDLPSGVTEPVPGVRTVLMTPSGELEGQPALSPDGKRMLFVREEEDRSSLWELDLETDRRTVLLSIPGEIVKHPAWSPDGERVVVVRDLLVRGLHVADRAALPAQGEAALRRVTDFGFHPAFSPDGARIAFSTASHDATSEVSYATRGSDIWVVEVEGRNPTRVLEGHGNMPDWSPSGSRLAYWAIDGSGRRNVLTIPAQGGEPVPVTEGPALDWNPRWSRDGEHLWFLSDRSGAGALWRVPVDERTGETRGAAEAVTTGGTTSPGFITFDSSGEHVAFHELTRRWNIQVLPLDPDTGRPTGEPRWLTRGDRRILAAMPSPDGGEVGFWERRTHEDIYFVDVATGQETQLTDDVAFDRGPTFSPDGSRLAFFSNREGGWAVWTMKLDGTGLTRAVAGAAWLLPHWSPDSRRLAVYDLELDRVAIVTLDEQGEETSRESILAQTPEGKVPALFDWSPDGQRLLMGWEDEITWETSFVVYHLDTDETEPLPRGEAEHLRFFDDQRLLGAADDGLGMVGPDGEVEILMEMDDQQLLWSIELSADRSLLVMVRGEETASMRVLALGEQK